MSQQKPVHKTEIYCEDFTVWTESYLGHLIIHCDVRKYNKTVLKNMHDAWNYWLATRDFETDTIYFAVQSDNNNTPKFAKMFGFTHMADAGGLKLYMRKV